MGLINRQGSDRVEMLNYLRDYGMPLDEYCYFAAVIKNDIQTLQWLKSVSCPWNASLVYSFCRTGSDAFNWLQENGFEKHPNVVSNAK